MGGHHDEDWALCEIARRQGYSRGRDGDGMQTNQYPRHDPTHGAWLAGWLEGHADWLNDRKEKTP